MQGYDQNRIWLLIVQLASDLLAWMAMLALQGPARRWEPKTLRHRLFTIAATLAHTGRRTILHLKQSSPWSTTALDGWKRLAALTPP